MRFHEASDMPESADQAGFDDIALERRLREAKDLAAETSDRPGTFRYSDAELGGEVRTSIAESGEKWSVAQAEVYGRDGSVRTMGTVRYSNVGDAMLVHHDTLAAPNHGSESSLLDEVRDDARSQGLDRLRVWVPDGNDLDENRWISHGFLPTERDPGARGVHWERRI